MELIETLGTTGAVRDFLPDAVPDKVVHRILDNARFAPSGGNRQGWHVVVAKDPGIRRAIRDAYLPNWDEYLAQRMAGLTPWAPVTDREVEATAIAGATRTDGDGFPYNLEQVPVLLVVLADLRALAALDRDHDRS